MTVASANTLIDRAVTQANLSDFGPQGWREGFDHLVAALSERDFGEPVLARFEARLVDVLSTRLRIEAWIARHPEILEAQIEGPVFIIGLPRTATTALQAFLATDPQWRYLRGWEAGHPTPPPEAASEDNDPRRLAELAQHAGPGVGQSQHIQEAGGPVDDAALLRLDFRNQELGWPAWSYTRWWRDCEMSTAYAYHARTLKLLQSRRPPNRWLVKAPWHNFHLDALVDQYPDATCVMCHRDPAELIPSVASLLQTTYRTVLGGEFVRPQDIGAFVLEHLQISIGRVMAFRSMHGDDRFIDVHHAEFNADPFGVVARIYGRLGRALSPAARAEMEAWQGRNRKGAHGEHRYTPEAFGLSAGQSVRRSARIAAGSADSGGRARRPHPLRRRAPYIRRRRNGRHDRG